MADEALRLLHKHSKERLEIVDRPRDIVEGILTFPVVMPRETNNGKREVSVNISEAVRQQKKALGLHAGSNSTDAKDENKLETDQKGRVRSINLLWATNNTDHVIALKEENNRIPSSMHVSAANEPTMYASGSHPLTLIPPTHGALGLFNSQHLVGATYETDEATKVWRTYEGIDLEAAKKNKRIEKNVAMGQVTYVPTASADPLMHLISLNYHNIAQKPTRTENEANSCEGLIFSNADWTNIESSAKQQVETRLKQLNIPLGAHEEHDSVLKFNFETVETTPDGNRLPLACDAGKIDRIPAMVMLQLHYAIETVK